jgi:uncharacterized protein (DUF697 family)
MQASIYLSGLYLLIQILFLIDFFMMLNENWTKDENQTKPLILTVILKGGSLIAYGLCFYVFLPAGCSINAVYIGINLAVSILLFVSAVILPDGSILTASLISAYTAYLTISALMCVDDCSRIASGSRGIVFSIVGSVFAIAWAAYSAFSVRNQFSACTCDGEDRPFSIAFFHSMFALAAVYVTMIITHWGDTAGEEVSWSTTRGSISHWVNLAAAWVTFLFYAWTLAAPYILTNREFGVAGV